MTKIADINEFNRLWHRVGSQLREEMYKSDYATINRLTMIDLSLLQTIEEQPNLIFKDICRTLGIPKSTLTSAVNRLEKKGYVKRKALQKDMRKYGLELTEMGKQAQREHIMTENVVFGNLLDGLSDAEVQQLLFLFEKGTKGL